jgi:glyoxylase-like metal-dependent hydrolase (beta-lactamase superfamily II)
VRTSNRTEDIPVEVLPGVYLIELPLPFSLGRINVYLVRLDSGYLLIDCGMDTAECFDALARAFESAGIAWHDIRVILITHVHPDHIGLARRLIQLTHAQLWMHAQDALYLEQLVQTEPYLAWAAEVLRESGVARKIIIQIGATSRGIHESFHSLHPDRLLAGGEKIPLADGVLEVLWTPGHTPGHLCLYDRQRRVLFSGDQILELISPNIGWQPGRDPLNEFLTSLEQLEKLVIDLILPSHGTPFSGHRDWIRKTMDHHRDRCNHILALLNGSPKTAATVVDGLWDRTLTPFHYRFAVFEVLAHLEYMERQGKLIRHRHDTVTLWQRAHAAF